MKTGKFKYFLMLAVFLLGAGIFLYPHFTNRIYENDVQQMKSAFEARMQPAGSAYVSHSGEMDEETRVIDPRLEELYQELQKWNEWLFDSNQYQIREPFSYEQLGFDMSKYGIDDNIIGYITIDKLNVVLPIMLGATDEYMNKAAVHVTYSSFPIGGINTNSIIAAHRGMKTQDMFRNIDRLNYGDEIVIENFRETLRYKVVEMFIIEPDEIDRLLIQPGRDLITLLTCHPLGQSTQRYVVFCERIVE